MLNNFAVSLLVGVLVEIIVILINKWLDKKPILVIGSVIAILIALFPLISLPTSPYIKVRNKLALPVNVYIDGEKEGKVQGQEEKIFFINSYPVEVKWEIVKLGEGASLSDTYTSVQNGQTLIINNVVDGKKYFFVKLTNNTSETCEIVVNDGYFGIVHGGLLLGKQKNIVLGYFPLEINSNVTLYCKSKTYWWGYRPFHPQESDSMLNLVEPDSGMLKRSIP